MLSEEAKASIGPGVAAALAEDVGAGDLTASLVDADAVVGAQILAREALVVCGQDWVDEVFRQLDETVVVDWYVGDGGRADADDIICKLVGPARSILSGERTALNFLQTLSATSTTTAAYVDAIADTGAKLLDTRKTIPGLRLAHCIYCCWPTLRNTLQRRRRQMQRRRRRMPGTGVRRSRRLSRRQRRIGCAAACACDAQCCIIFLFSVAVILFVRQWLSAP